MSKRIPSSTRDEHFPKINATPEQLAKALIQVPPLKPEEWKFMQKKPREDQH